MFIATPAALLSIAAGTALFPWVPTTAGWLAAKLAVVAGLMGSHLMSGWAVLRLEEIHSLPPGAGPVLTWLTLSAMLLTLWLVLAKPA